MIENMRSGRQGELGTKLDDRTFDAHSEERERGKDKKTEIFSTSKK